MITKYLLVAVGILASALAQIMLKKTSILEIRSSNWLVFIVLSCIFYLVAFLFYYVILKFFPISKISPVMTIGVMILVVIFGIYIGETISLKLLFGLLLGMFSIYLILTSL